MCLRGVGGWGVERGVGGNGESAVRESDNGRERRRRGVYARVSGNCACLHVCMRECVFRHRVCVCVCVCV